MSGGKEDKIVKFKVTIKGILGSFPTNLKSLINLLII